MSTMSLARTSQKIYSVLSVDIRRARQNGASICDVRASDIVDTGGAMAKLSGELPIWRLAVAFLSVGMITSSLAALGLAWLTHSPPVALIGGGVIGFWLSAAAVRNIMQEKLRAGFQAEKLKEIVEEHFAPLSRNLQKTLIKNDYGVIVADQRVNVIEDFVGSLQLPVDLLRKQSTLYQVVLDKIDELTIVSRSKDFDPTQLPTTGIEFEFWVAEGLRKFGWNSRVTAGSGDQGVDVIAEKGALKVAIQCKMYNSKVGNKAVQEVVAGRDFHFANRAAVISNAEYTTSAKALASVHSVALCSIYDIPRMDDLCA